MPSQVVDGDYQKGWRERRLFKKLYRTWRKLKNDEMDFEDPEYETKCIKNEKLVKDQQEKLLQLYKYMIQQDILTGITMEQYEFMNPRIVVACSPIEAVNDRITEYLNDREVLNEDEDVNFLSHIYSYNRPNRNQVLQIIDELRGTTSLLTKYPKNSVELEDLVEIILSDISKQVKKVGENESIAFHGNQIEKYEARNGKLENKISLKTDASEPQHVMLRADQIKEEVDVISYIDPSNIVDEEGIDTMIDNDDDYLEIIYDNLQVAKNDFVQMAVQDDGGEHCNVNISIEIMSSSDDGDEHQTKKMSTLAELLANMGSEKDDYSDGEVLLDSGDEMQVLCFTDPEPECIYMDDSN